MKSLLNHVLPGYKVYHLLFIFSILPIFSEAQSGWTAVYSGRGNFSFSFPQPVNMVDTLTLLSYFSNYPDSTIAFQVNYMDGVYASGNPDMQEYIQSTSNMRLASSSASSSCYVDSIESVLVTYTQMYQQVTEGSLEGFIVSDYIPCIIRGKEFTIRYPDPSGNGNYYFAFSRYYYWNQKFLAFTVTGPEFNLTQLSSFKNQFFNSVSIIP